MTNSIYDQMLSRIIKTGKGKLIFPADFTGLGSNESIRKALSRLVKEKILLRLGQGIYLYPEYDPELGTLYPSTEDIAEAVARQDKARIIPTGAQALYKLRLSQQVPMKLVYLTDGVRRMVKVGKNTITFKITTPKKLAMQGKVSALVIQALQALGQKQVDDKVIKQIKKALAKEDVNLLRHDAGLAPGWIATILFSLFKELNNAGMAENNG
ncbi:MAG TPA: DUF6088 family protein [Puia sp.]